MFSANKSSRSPESHQSPPPSQQSKNISLIFEFMIFYLISSRVNEWALCQQLVYSSYIWCISIALTFHNDLNYRRNFFVFSFLWKTYIRIKCRQSNICDNNQSLRYKYKTEWMVGFLLFCGLNIRSVRIIATVSVFDHFFFFLPFLFLFLLWLLRGFGELVVELSLSIELQTIVNNDHKEFCLIFYLNQNYRKYR